MNLHSQLITITRNKKLQISNLIKAIKLEIFRRVIINTRVDTGAAKGNWQITEGSPASGEVENFDKTPLGSLSDSKLQEMNDTIEGISISFLTNNLPYIKKLEELDAMVATAAFQLQEMISENARR